jgi:hypothetical protein
LSVRLKQITCPAFCALNGDLSISSTASSTVSALDHRGLRGSEIGKIHLVEYRAGSRPVVRAAAEELELQRLFVRLVRLNTRVQLNHLDVVLSPSMFKMR